MNDFSLKCFGVGDGWPCADRTPAAFLYRFGKVTFLIDCGEPISCSYKATEPDYNAIDRIFISHLHSDHIAGFFMLVQGFWLEKRKKELPIHLPADGIKPLRQMLDAAYLFDELMPFRLLFEPLQAGQPVVTDNARVTPYRSSHLDGLRASFQKKYPQDFTSYCFLLESDRLRIGHSADIGAPEDLSPLLEKPLDLLVCELAHFKPEDLFRFLKGREIGRIVLTHLGRRYWADLDAMRQLAARMLPDIPISIAQNGEEFTL